MRLSPVFSAIDTPTVPVPVWLAPEVMVAKAALDVAVHAQPLLVVTPIEALAPMLAMLSAVVDSANVHAVVGGVGVGEDGDRELEQDAQTITDEERDRQTSTHGSSVVALTGPISKLSRYSARKVTAGSTDAADRAGR